MGAIILYSNDIAITISRKPNTDRGNLPVYGVEIKR